MSKIVNLNRARKAKAKSDKRRQADENAVRFGMTKAQKQKDQKIKTINASRHDDKKLDP